LAISTPLRNIGERCRDSAAIQAFSDDGKYLIKAPYDGYKGIGENLLEGSTNQTFMYGTSGYGP
jgi:hypothetical protein